MAPQRDRRDTEDRVRRLVLGVVNILLAAMLVLAVAKFRGSIGRVYGDRFFYVPVAMLALAVWRGAVGLYILLGRRRGA